LFKLDIGVEIHAELLTEEKLFCGCKNEFNHESNINICPVCTGLPGALPIVNGVAVELASKAGLMVKGKINRVSRFDRKNYFYVDNPKNYQVTQFYKPIVSGGYVEYLTNDDKVKKVRLIQIHIEEDAGKLIHKGEFTYIDFNRAGVPLIEIVTEPDIHSEDECVAFLNELRKILLWNKISDCRMEEGSIRFDLNISLREEGEELGQRIEVKNINSFKSVEKCIGYEYKRQSEILKSGGTIEFETRRWDDKKEKTITLRKKEEAKDYRYIPDGDLFEVIVDDVKIEELKNTLVKTPLECVKELQEKYGLNTYNSKIIGGNGELYNFFKSCGEKCAEYNEICMFLLGEISGILNEKRIPLSKSRLNSKDLCEIIEFKKKGIINNNAAKELIRLVIGCGESVEKLIARESMAQNNDIGEIEKIISDVLENNIEKVEEYRRGKDKLYGWFFGNVMKMLKGKGNPAIVKEILEEKLKK